MRAHKLAVAAAGGAIGLMAAAPLAAWADSAPVGSASGSDLTVGASGSPIASVSSTSAQAGSDTSGSSADVLNVGGTTVIGGSSSDGNNQSGGTSLTPSGSPVQVEVTPYSATSTAPSNGQSSSEGQAAVARLAAGPLTTNVLQSQSNATYTNGSDGSTKSSGSSSTDGLTLTGPGLDVDVLHSQANSAGQGSSYLLGINGTDIGTSQQLSSVCSTVNIPSTLALSCDAASGGVGSLLEQLLAGNVGSSPNGVALDAFGSSGAGGSGPGLLAAGGGPVHTAAASAPAVTTAPAGPGTATNGPSGGLPFTGAPIALWFFGSMALVGLGAVTVKASSLAAPHLFG